MRKISDEEFNRLRREFKLREERRQPDVAADQLLDDPLKE